jgi:Spy/CpxP family protein refolding chaperone
MNFFLRNRLAFWVMIFVIILNSALFISFFLFNKMEKTGTRAACETAGCNSQGISQELGLSEVQSKKIEAINLKYRTESEPIAQAIRQKRDILLTGLEVAEPDTLELQMVIDSLGNLQKEIQMLNIRQFLELKKVCNPEQALRLSALYRNLYGCPMQGNNNQKKHQYRHGQKKNDTSCCN